MKKILLTFACFVVIAFSACQTQKANPPTNVYEDGRTLIVISAPSVCDTYYAEVFNKVIEYDIQFAKSVMGHDNVVVLADIDTLPFFKGKLPDDVLLESNVKDIWVRDFGTASPARMVQFVYAPRYLDKSTSELIRTSFREMAVSLNLQFVKSNIVLDGGNIVDNHVDKAIVTTRVLEDNPTMSRDKIVAKLKQALGVKYLAIIPEEEGDTTGHADGMAMWADDNTLLITSYDQPFRSKVMMALSEAFPTVKIIEVKTGYVPQVWRGFDSACGINANAIVTDRYIYVPVFNNNTDNKFLDTLRQNTKKQVVTVDAKTVCIMGGSVRCLSWQVTGENARKLIEAARKQ